MNSVTTASRIKERATEQFSQEDVLATGIDIFVTRSPNAIGKAAYKFDKDGHLYREATGHKKYYPLQGEISALHEQTDTIANRCLNTQRLVVIGPGPGEIFKIKEGMLVEAIPSLNEVVTIDLAEHFNEQAKKIVKELSQKLSRNIRHSSLTMDYRQAAELNLIVPGPSTLVTCTGGLITNTETKNHSIFPVTELRKDLHACGKIAGSGGQVLVTYDSNNDKALVLSAYDTRPFKNLYLNVLDVIEAVCPEHFPGISRKNFTVQSEWDAVTQAVQHQIVVRKDINFSVVEKGGRGSEFTHHIHLHAGQRLHIIPSYKPSVATMRENVVAVGLRTDIVSRENRGSTVHLMNVPKI